MALHQQLPFFNPSVPFTTPIQGGLKDGMIITVCGRVLPDANRFDVDFLYGSDHVLHFNPRYDGGSGLVVHNTLQKGIWGSEENKSQTPFPRGQTFALQIFVTQGSYKISTNGKPFSEFEHRMPFSWADTFRIVGKVELSLVAFQRVAPPHAACSGSFMVPYKSVIPGGLQPGKVIIIHGVISPQANRVVISLRHKHGIAFAYSPRFDENVVVRNTYQDGQWGAEERSELLPYKRGALMQVTIFCSHHQYEVFVNGEKTHTYKHRYTKLEEIDVLDIRGDMQLTFVQP
ncbi:galectin-9-like isoform X1 [Chanodichthys erythropterus]|uniref:galectin-9-like isoform X1 n=1 Tax=Chanodichthys erythropterus TaxID=933992 RepID=UPI00351E6E61